MAGSRLYDLMYHLGLARIFRRLQATLAQFALDHRAFRLSSAAAEVLHIEAARHRWYYKSRTGQYPVVLSAAESATGFRSSASHLTRASFGGCTIQGVIVETPHPAGR